MQYAMLSCMNKPESSESTIKMELRCDSPRIIILPMKVILSARVRGSKTTIYF